MVGDLHGTTALHTQVEDAFHHISGYRVNHPAAGVLQVLYIAIGHIGGQGYASLTLGFLDGSDLAAGVPGIELVEPVFDARKIVVHTVRVNGVVVVVDGDETNTVLRKGEVGVKPGQRGVAAQSGKVFGDRHGHPSRLDFGQHGLKAGTVIGHTAYTVIHEKGWVGEVMLPGILQKHGLLRRDLSRLFSPAEYKCPTLL